MKPDSFFRSLAALAIILLVTFAAPAVGVFSMPDEWYVALRKPSWNPPAWIFGPVWTLLYLLMAAAAWCVWRNGGWEQRRRELGLYLGQLGSNAIWTPLFFGLRRPDLALIDIVVLVVLVLATMRSFLRVDRVAGYLLVPYLAWIGFATVLNFTLWWMNR